MSDERLDFEGIFTARRPMDGGDWLVLKLERGRWHITVDRQRDGEHTSLGEDEIAWVAARFEEIRAIRDATNRAFSDAFPVVLSAGVSGVETQPERGE